MNSSNLCNNLNGITIIEDCLEASGILVFKVFLNKLASNVDRIILCVIERQSELMLDGLPESVLSKIQVIDWYGEKSPVHSECNDSAKLIYANLETELRSLILNENVTCGRVALAFDSLTLLLYLTSDYKSAIDSTSGLLYRLHKPTWPISNNENSPKLPPTVPVMALVHGELLRDEISRNRLASISTSWFRLSRDKQRNLSVCHSVVQGPKRKVEKRAESFEVDIEKLTITNEKPFHKPSPPSALDMALAYESEPKPTTKAAKEKVSLDVKVQPQTLPTASFRLTLSEAERKARDSVALPYMAVQDVDNQWDPEEGLVGISKKKSDENPSGKIVYVPDEADDLDESDPDDDLEI